MAQTFAVRGRGTRASKLMVVDFTCSPLSARSRGLLVRRPSGCGLLRLLLGQPRGLLLAAYGRALQLLLSFVGKSVLLFVRECAVATSASPPLGKDCQPLYLDCVPSRGGAIVQCGLGLGSGGPAVPLTPPLVTARPRFCAAVGLLPRHRLERVTLLSEALVLTRQHWQTGSLQNTQVPHEENGTHREIVTLQRESKCLLICDVTNRTTTRSNVSSESCWKAP